MKKMKKWQQQNNRKSHLCKIYNAKSTINTQPHKKKIKKYTLFNQYSTIQTQVINSKQNFNKNQLYLILKQFGIQQYFRQLTSRGYNNFKNFKLLNNNQMEELIDSMKILPGHRNKLKTLYFMISTIMFNIKQRNSKRCKSSIPIKRKQFRQNVIDMQNHLQKYSYNLKNSKNSLSPYSPKLSKNNTLSNYHIKFNNQKKQLKLPTKYNNIRMFIRDDIGLINKYINQSQGLSYGQSKVMKNLYKKIQKNHQQNLQLHYQEIKQLYLSYGSAKLTSTILNLDMEQICYCFSAAVLPLIKQENQDLVDIDRLIKPKMKKHQIYKSQQSSYSIEQKQKHSNIETPLITQLGYLKHNLYLENSPQNLKISFPKLYDIEINKDQIDQQIFKNKQLIQSMVNSSILRQKYQYQYSRSKQCQNNTNQQLEQLLPSKQCNSFQQQTITNSSILQSYFFQYAKDQLSLKHLFYKTYCRQNDPLLLIKPSLQNIENFLKNIVMAGKIQRQVPIIAYIYIQKLLKKSGGVLKPSNWRTSKIWDDQSFQNDNFSKILPDYGSAEINYMQKIFLKFLEYKLTIAGDQYATIYFRLRNNVNKEKKSYALRSLNMSTIFKLQHNTSKAQVFLKDKFKNKLNKSF